MGTPGDGGLLLILFVLVFSLLSLLFNIAIPFSVVANRWLMTALAFGLLLFYVDRRFR